MATPGFICVISRPKSAATQADFANECREAHQGRRVFLEGGGITVARHEHYEAEENCRGSLDVYQCDDIEPLLSGSVILAEGGDGPLLDAHSYVYKQLGTSSEVTDGTSHSLSRQGKLITVSLNPPMSILDDMNRWYEEEHHGTLSKVPGWINTQRGKMLAMSSKADDQLPKYIVMHRFDSTEDPISTEEWQAAQETAWAVRIKDSVDKPQDIVRSVWRLQG